MHASRSTDIKLYLCAPNGSDEATGMQARKQEACRRRHARFLQLIILYLMIEMCGTLGCVSRALNGTIRPRAV